MTDDEAFLAAIRANPDDDVVRLAFADWLDEHNNSRGEFIRVQCALAQLVADDPHQEELAQREQELLSQHGEVWRGESPQTLEVWFERGLPWVETNAEVLTEPSASRWLLDHQSWVFALCLRDADDRSFRHAVDHGLLAQATALTLISCRRSGPRLTDTGLRCLAGLTQLRELDLWASGVTSAGLASLAKLTQLQHLSLGGFPVTAVGLEHLTRLKQLQKLYLYRMTGAGLRHLAGLTQLRELILHSPVTELRLEHLAGLTQLQELGLRGRKVTDTGLQHLAGLTDLQELHLEGTSVTDAGLRHLFGLKQLQNVYLGDTRVTRSGIRELKKARPGCHITCH
jgi:uncharacterized protein (TIGR02996 family)